MSNEILKQLLNEILNLQIELAEKRQENKENFKKLEQLANAYKKLKQEKEEGELIFGSIILIIIFCLLVKILIAYFF